MKKVEDFVSNSMTQAILVIVGILVCIGVIVYVTYRIMSTSLKAVDVTRQQLTRADGPGLEVANSELPAMLNGLEFGYSFWVYIEKYEATQYPRQVMRQENVLISLGNNANTMRIEFGVNGAKGQAEIEFVPMARWVHIVAMYREGAVTFFMDGEVHSVHRVTKSGYPDHPTGNLVIGGGGGSNTNTSKWKGSIGNVVVLNYYPSMTDVKKFYWRGPSSNGTLKWVGMQKYGVRTPVYKLPQ
jgi:hypothetical protein